MKLELKHLAPYLPYGLEYVKYSDHNSPIRHDIMQGISTNGVYASGNITPVLFKNCKPILRPLSDLTKVNSFSLSDMISHGYYNSFWLPENFNIAYLMHLDFEKLVSWHFDVFKLIEKGLAIDINKI